MAAGPIVDRTPVEPHRPYSEYREALRRDFYWACAYCSLTEFEGRGHSFQIDHYHPQTRGGTDHYGNLYYACQTCNLKKRAWWFPLEVCGEYHPLRIDLEDPRAHVDMGPSPDSRVQHRTATGEFNVELFDLNRESLRKIRRIRASLADSSEQIAHGLRTLRNLRIDELPRKYKAQVVRLRSELERSGRDVEIALEQFLRDRCASELIDPDSEAPARAAKCREYLHGIKAVLARPK